MALRNVLALVHGTASLLDIALCGAFKFPVEHPKAITIENSTNVRDLAEQHFRPAPVRHEKGSALGLIAAEAKANDDKSARLKTLRLERDTAFRPEPRKATPTKTIKRIVRR